jgi:hypothetical protein
MAKFPHTVQICLLFDEVKPLDLNAFVSDFVKAEASAGNPYNVAERTPLFSRLYDGANDVMLTIEVMPGRAQDAVFGRALSSNYNLLLAPDAKERIQRHKSHLLINLHHGVLPDMGEKMGFMEQLGVLPGQTVQLFQKRLAIAERAAALINDRAPVSLVHQTMFNVLVPGPVFAAIVAPSVTPHMLQLHPYVYSTEKHTNGSWKYGLKTLGASYFIDREIHLAPSHIAWPESVENALVFIRLSLLENGYIIPDGDTFGPPDNSWSYRITHIPAGEKSDDFEGPLYRMDLVMHKATNFETTSYVKPVRTFDDRTIPADLKADIGRGLPKFEKKLRSRREMAEKAGGGFYARTDTVDPKDESPARRGLLRWMPFLRGKRE